MEITVLSAYETSAKEFFEGIQKAKADVVVDVRLHNTNQLAGFTKEGDLAYFIPAILKIPYIHDTRFAPSLGSLIERVYGCVVNLNSVFTTSKDKLVPNILIRDNVYLPELAEKVFNDGYSKNICDTYIHILEKYSKYGYARRNSVYSNYYRAELSEFYERVATLTPDEIMVYLTY
jgi:hypothetical protein